MTISREVARENAPASSRWRVVPVSCDDRARGLPGRVQGRGAGAEHPKLGRSHPKVPTGDPGTGQGVRRTGEHQRRRFRTVSAARAARSGALSVDRTMRPGVARVSDLSGAKRTLGEVEAGGGRAAGRNRLFCPPSGLSIQTPCCSKPHFNGPTRRLPTRARRSERSPRSAKSPGFSHSGPAMENWGLLRRWRTRSSRAPAKRSRIRERFGPEGRAQAEQADTSARDKFAAIRTAAKELALVLVPRLPELPGEGRKPGVTTGGGLIAGPGKGTGPPDVRLRRSRQLRYPAASSLQPGSSSKRSPRMLRLTQDTIQSPEAALQAEWFKAASYYSLYY